MSAAPVLAGCEPDYPPYCLVLTNGAAAGFSVDLLRASLQAMDRGVAFRTAPWKELLRDLAEGRLQVLPLVGRTPEREPLFDFTFPYLTMHGTIMVREDRNDIAGPADLTGKQVAVLAGDNAEEYLRRSGLGATLVALPSFETALRELSAGRHDAVVIQKLLAFQLMQQTGLHNLKAAGPPLKDFRQDFCFAVRKGNAELLATLNEGLSIVMADGTFRRLYTQWFSSLEAMSRPRSRIILGGDNDYPPYSFADANGQPAGFLPDIVRAIARHMELALDLRTGPWADIRGEFDRGRLDGIAGMIYSAERDQTADFSPPIASIKNVIVTRRGAPDWPDLKSLADRSVIVMKSDVMHDVAIQQGMESRLVPVGQIAEALGLLAAGHHDAALLPKVPALYAIERGGWRNLKVADHSLLSADLCLAVPHGQEALLADLAEGLAAIKSSGEFRAIQARWLGPYEQQGLRPWLIVRYVLGGAIPLIILLAGSLLWSHMLKVQVAMRTRELETANRTLQSEIAERERIAAELRQARDEAEAANRAKSTFLATMSHEIRTPMNAIQGFAELALGTPLTQEQRQYLDIVANRSRDLLAILNDILDLSRIEADRLELNPQPLDLRHLLHEVEAFFSETSRRGLALATRLAEDVPPVLVFDGLRLKQILLNLVGNAIKFTDHGGVTVRVAREPAPDTPASAGPLRLRFTVEDTGMGIPEDQREAIFSPFTQVDGSLTRRHGGAGLGLAIVRRLVEKMNGRVWCESEPGRGSRFHFTVCGETPAKG